MKMQGIIPTAKLRFHDALDRMERDINTAQQILKRDLALHRVTEKQKAEKALAPKEIKQEPALQPQSSVAKKDEDVIMVDKPVELPKTNPTAPTRQPEPTQPKQQESTPTISQAAPAMIATSAPATEQPQPITATVPEEETTTDAMDFSEFFGDDLTADPTATANDDTQLHLPTDFDDASADVSSLLPGVESFANMPDDNAIPTSSAAAEVEGAIPHFNLPDFGTAVTQAQSQPGGAEVKVDDQTGEVDFGDIDFNFADTGTGGGSGNGRGAGGGQDGDNTFDDLFDLDDYFGGAADGGGGASSGSGGQDVSDWMNSL
jgi:hypothetical protein